MTVGEATSADEAYLDAARERILAVGWRRTTLTDVARGAGVSRMTIYRRWPDMRALLADLLVREWAGLLDEAGVEAGDGVGDQPAREQLAGGVPRMVAALRGNALFAKIVDLDPELLHPYLFERLGRNQGWILGVLEGFLRSGQQDGSIRAGDPELLAHTTLLACYGFVLSAHTFGSSLDRLDAELGSLIDRYLAP